MYGVRRCSARGKYGGLASRQQSLHRADEAGGRARGRRLRQTAGCHPARARGSTKIRGYPGPGGLHSPEQAAVWRGLTSGRGALSSSPVSTMCRATAVSFMLTSCGARDRQPKAASAVMRCRSTKMPLAWPMTSRLASAWKGWPRRRGRERESSTGASPPARAGGRTRRVRAARARSTGRVAGAGREAGAVRPVHDRAPGHECPVGESLPYYSSARQEVPLRPNLTPALLLSIVKALPKDPRNRPDDGTLPARRPGRLRA